jgi:hypothetical protein
MTDTVLLDCNTCVACCASLAYVDPAEEGRLVWGGGGAPITASYMLRYRREFDIQLFMLFYDVLLSVYITTSSF